VGHLENEEKNLARRNRQIQMLSMADRKGPKEDGVVRKPNWWIALLLGVAIEIGLMVADLSVMPWQPYLHPSTLLVVFGTRYGYGWATMHEPSFPWVFLWVSLIAWLVDAVCYALVVYLVLLAVRTGRRRVRKSG
jgi:hypothetical protein